VDEDVLAQALEKIGLLERGVVLYLRQEGRGIGLANKIRAYALQDLGLDTVEANLALGFRDDERDYAVAAHMLGSLGIASIELMTNNPAKISQLEQYGVKVSRRLPTSCPPPGTTASTWRPRPGAAAISSISPTCRTFRSRAIRPWRMACRSK